MDFEEKKLYWEAKEVLGDVSKTITDKEQAIEDIISKALEHGKKKLMEQIERNKKEYNKERDFESRYPRL